jgi:hypothetical protein
MRLRSEITIPAPRDRAWQVLGNVGSLTGSAEVDLHGEAVEWVANLRQLDVDEDAGLVTLRLHSREARGPGLAVGTLEGRVSEAGGSSVLVLEGDVRVSGGLAAAQAAGDLLLADIARRLEQRILEPGGSHAAQPAERGGAPEPQPPSVPLGAVAVPAAPSGPALDLLRRVGPAAAAAAAVVVAAALLGRSPQRRRRGRLGVRR